MKIYKNSYISESGLTNRDIVNVISALHLDKEDKYCYIMSRNLIYRRDDVNFVKTGRIMKCFYGFFSVPSLGHKYSVNGMYFPIRFVLLNTSVIWDGYVGKC